MAQVAKVYMEVVFQVNIFIYEAKFEYVWSNFYQLFFLIQTNI